MSNAVSDSKKLDFLRVLIAAAWADGEMSCEELNNLKAYFREFELDDQELAALEPYLADPLSEAEAAVVVEDFLECTRGKERAAVIAAVRDLILADGALREGEKTFLYSLERARREATTASVFVGQLKRLWGSSERRSGGGLRRSDLLDEFVRNRVLYQVKRRLLLATGGRAMDEEIERELRYVCAVGALLGHIAGADDVFDDHERAAIAVRLDRLSTLQPRDIEIILEIVESEVLADVGYYSFAREFNEIAGPGDRCRVLECLFDVAAADGAVTHEEHEEIRKISKALNVSHAEFIAVKKKSSKG